MVQVPILSGIFTSNGPDMRIAYPVNMVPVPADSGISKGYLRPADGIVGQGEGTGVARGGIEWRGILYRVMGSSLVSVDVNGVVSSVIGDVGDNGVPVSFSYGFDRLAIASNGTLYYLTDANVFLTVTDPNAGVVLDVQWIDGYFAVTDGEFVAFSDINDPMSFDPFKYVSSESDPDPVVALARLRNELLAVNRNSIETLANVGGSGAPFARIAGAKITKGAIGKDACCIFLETLAFVGSGYNEAPGVYLGVNAQAQKISTVEVDRVLASFTEDELSQVVVETRNDNAHQHLYIHLLDRTLVYDAAASQALGAQVWFTLVSTLEGMSIYRARFFVWCFDRWNSADPTSFVVGYLTQSVSSHYGQPVRWEFGTSIIYNDGRGAVISELELVGLTGRVLLGKDPVISTSYSLDGMEWSLEKSIPAGKIGQRQKRLVWFKQGSMLHWRIQRFRGTSDAHISFTRLEAQITGSAF